MTSQRTSVGVAVLEDLDRIAAAVLRISGRGLEMRVEVVAATARELPDRVAESFCAVTTGSRLPPAELAVLTAELADVQARVVRRVVKEAGDASRGTLPVPLAVGTHGPAVWLLAPDQPRARVQLGDGSRLAESTGYNVVDGFPDRDLARGGLGGPIEPLAQWALLHDAKRNRVLLNLDRATRMTYLPRGCEPTAASRVSATDVGPGTALFDAIAGRAAAAGKLRGSSDPLAHQGRCIQPLLARLLDAPYFDESPPRWHPHGAPLDWFVGELNRWRREQKADARDLVRTALDLVAAASARCLRQHVPSSPSPVQLVLSGRGAQNGLLLSELRRHLPPFECVMLADLGIERDALDAACVAVLAMLHVDQVPQTSMQTTRIQAPRVLGQLTPGSPLNWQRLLREMGVAAPTKISLRAAI